MKFFGIRDLRNRTGELVRAAEAGELSVVSKHGKPVFVAVPFNDSLLRNGVATSMAIKLYSDHSISLSKAAVLAGMPLVSFVSLLGTMGIPVVDYDPAELKKELAVLNRE